MKKFWALCMGIMLFVSCENRDKEAIVVDATKVTLSSQGTATILCRVSPSDMDGATLGLYFSAIELHTSDSDVNVGIISIFKDSGNWTVTLGLVKGSKAYTPKANFKCTMVATAHLKKKDGLIKSNSFSLSANINN